jgi:hypothetical protein
MLSLMRFRADAAHGTLPAAILCYAYAETPSVAAIAPGRAASGYYHPDLIAHPLREG